MSKEKRLISKEELKQHKDAKSLWLAIHDQVYDVTKFMEEVSGLGCTTSSDLFASRAANQHTQVWTNLLH